LKQALRRTNDKDGREAVLVAFTRERLTVRG
jgi:hypothetical protein